jgi:hypothetical protein
MLKGILDQASCSILNSLKRFYQSPEYQPSQSKRGLSLQQVLQMSRLPSGRIPSQNYYESLLNLVLEDDTYIYSSPIMQNKTSSTQSYRKPSSNNGKSPAPEGVAAVFPEDLGIAAVSILMNYNQHNTSTDMDEDKGQQTISQEPPPSTTTIISSNIQPKIFRLNLIRHNNATPTELTTLQLFKAFLTMAKETDKTMIIHPVDSTKQHLTSLMSKKQIDSLTLNQLRLYFSSWYKDLSHSISGFVHLGIRHQFMPSTNIIFNDNRTCVNWSKRTTTKGLRHIQMKENRVWENILNDFVRICHIDGKINLADLFTKEMKDVSHFVELRNLMMCSRLSS